MNETTQDAGSAGRPGDYQAVFDLNPAPMWILERRSLRFLRANNALLARLGHTRESLLALSLRDILLPEEEEAFLRALTQPPAGGRVGVWRHRAINGTVLDLDVTVTPLDFDGEPALLGVLEDAGARAGLEAHRVLLRGVLDSACGAVFTLDRDGRYTSFNQAHAGIMKALYGADIAVGGCLYDYQSRLADREKARTNVQRALAGETVVEDAYSGGGGHPTMHFQVSHAPIYGWSGEITGVAVCALDTTARKQTEEALAASERRFSALLQNTCDLVTIIDPDGIILFESPNILRQLGYEPATLRGRNALELVHPGDREKAARVLERLGGQPGGTVRIEHRLRAADDSWRWYESLGTNLCADPAVGGIVLNSRDITEQHDVRQAVDTKHALLRAVMDTAIGPLCTLDRDGRYTGFNREYTVFMQELFGVAISTGMRLLEAVNDPILREKAWSNIVRALGGESIVDEVPFPRQDGGTVFMQISHVPIRESSGEISGVALFGIDVTRLRSVEKALIASEYRFRLALRNTPLSVATFDRDLRFTWVYNTGRGYTPDQVLGRRVDEVLPPPDAAEVVALQQQVLASGIGTRRDIAVRISGETLYYDVAAEPLRNDAGDITGLTWISVDISEKRRMQDALRASERRLKALADNLPDAMLYRLEGDATGHRHFTYVSEAVTRLFELERDAVLADAARIYAMILPECAPAVQAAEEEVLKGRPRFDAEFAVRLPSGRIRWFQVASAITRKPDGGVVSEGAMLDITVRKAAEKALRDSSRRLTMLVDNLPGAVLYRIEADGSGKRRFTYISENVERVHGVSVLAAMEDADAIYDQILPECRPGLRVAEEKAIRNAEMFRHEYRARLPDGRIRWFEAASKLTRRADDSVISEGVILDISARKEMEEALRVSEQHFHTLAEASPAGIFRTNARGENIYVNARYADIVGRDVSDLLGTGYHATVHPDDRELLGRTLDFLPEAHAPIRSAYRVIRPDGSLRWVQAVAMPEVDGNGRLQGYVGTLEDITERHLFQEALGNSEAKFRRLYESITDAVVVVTMDGRLLDWNRAYLEMLGYSADELRNLTYIDITPEKWHADEARIVAEEIIPRGYSGVYEKEYRRKGGEIFPVELRTYLIKDDAGRPDRMWAIVRDVTRRKNAERALRESEERSRILIQNAPEAIVVYDADQRRIVDANPMAEQLFGCGVAELTRGGPERFYTPVQPDGRPIAETVVEHDRQVLTEGPVRFERLIHARDGREVHCDVHLTMLPYTGRRLVRGTFVDITARKKAEETLRDFATKLEEQVKKRTQELSSAVDSLRAEIQNRLKLERQLLEISEREQRRIGQDLHDSIGQSLAAVKFLSSTLEKDLEGIDHPGVADLAAQLTRLLDDVTRDVRTVSRGLHPVGPEPEGLMSALSELSAAVTRIYRIPCEFACAGPVLLPDPHQATICYRIVQEAVNNAVRHARPGRIVIGIRREPDGEIGLSVADDGCGMPTSAVQGPGLGQTIMRYRAAMINARLDVRPAPRGGTVVECRFGGGSRPEVI